MKIIGKNPIVDTQVKMQDAGKDIKMKKRSSTNKSMLFDKLDKVNFSDKAKKLANLRKLVEASPDVRQEKIEQIKDSIDDGKYNLKAAKVAEAIIRKAIDFQKSHRTL